MHHMFKKVTVSSVQKKAGILCAVFAVLAPADLMASRSAQSAAHSTTMAEVKNESSKPLSLTAISESVKTAATSSKAAIASIADTAYNLPGKAVGLVATGGQSAQPIQFITGNTHSLAKLTGYKTTANQTGWTFTDIGNALYEAPGKAVAYVNGKTEPAKLVPSFLKKPTKNSSDFTLTAAQPKSITINTTALPTEHINSQNNGFVDHLQTEPKMQAPRVPLTDSVSLQTPVQQNRVTNSTSNRAKNTPMPQKAAQFSFDTATTFTTRDGQDATFENPQSMAGSDAIYSQPNTPAGRLSAAQASVISRLAVYGKNINTLQPEQQTAISAIVNTELAKNQHPIITAGNISTKLSSYFNGQHTAQ